MRLLLDETRVEQKAARLRARAAFSRVGWALLALLVVAAVTQATLQLLVSRFLPDWYEAESFLWVLNSVPMYLVGMPVCWLLLRSLPQPPAPTIREAHPVELFLLIAVTIAMSLLGGYGTNLLAGLVEYLAGHTAPNPASMLNDFHPVPALLLACVAAPFAEEWLFRGVLLRKLQPYGDGLAIFASAFTFMLLHTNLYQTINIFLVGLVFGYITVRSGTVWYAIILHMTLNLFGTILPRLVVAGNTLQMALAGLLLILLFPFGVITAWRIWRFRLAGPQPLHGANIGVFLSSPGQLVYFGVCIALLITNAL